MQSRQYDQADEMGMMFGLPLLSGVPTRTTEVPECRMSGEMVRVVERFTLCDPTKAESGKTICRKKGFSQSGYISIGSPSATRMPDLYFR